MLLREDSIAQDGCSQVCFRLELAFLGSVPGDEFVESSEESGEGRWALSRDLLVGVIEVGCC